MGSLKIFHLSDMHLFCDKNGKLHPPTKLGKATRLMKLALKSELSPACINRWGDGLNSHSKETLDALWPTLSNICNKTTQHLILVQTGDVAAYGHSGDTTCSFPAFDYWENKKATSLPTIDKAVDVYGNHDVWPGALPFSKPRSVKTAIEDLRGRIEFKDPMPTIDIVKLNSYRIELYRLNTVCYAWPINSFAAGLVQTDYPIRSGKTSKYPVSRDLNPINELIALLKREEKKNLGEKAVRILVMHHPLYHFSSDKSFRIMDGRLLRRDKLLSALKKERFHLILAGHKHLIDPPEQDPYIGLKNQKSILMDRTIQLSAGSVTQTPSQSSSIRPSFCVYSISIDESKDTIAIERETFIHESDSEPEFICQTKTEIIKDYPI